MVKWWEEDCLNIDENAHLLLQFEGDGTYMWDFVTPRQIHDELNDLLAAAGISWEYGFELLFGSRILYPAEFVGQTYYEKVPRSPKKKWWEQLLGWLTGNAGEHWERRRDLPLP